MVEALTILAAHSPAIEIFYGNSGF